jgi:hypothetical protein
MNKLQAEIMLAEIIARVKNTPDVERYVQINEKRKHESNFRKR